jgi:type IV pilus assembly protein PilA
MKKAIQKGFTLIELMIVVAIIGILAAVALPAYQDYLTRSQVSESVNLAGGFKQAVQDFYADKGAYDSIDNGFKGLPLNAASTIGKYTSGVTIVNGVITATIGRDASAAVQNDTVILSPIAHAGSMEWKCRGGASIEVKYLPTACK